MQPCCDLLGSFIRGENLPWTEFGLAPAAFFDLCGDQGVTGLVYQRARHLPSLVTWPDQVLAGLARHAHAEEAAEIVRAAEIRDTLAALASAEVPAILLKGTALAYGVYSLPGARPRGDTDLIIPGGVVQTALTQFLARGFTRTLHCDDLFSQFEVQKHGPCGVVHAFDVHWKISTQPIFAELLSYEELDRDAEPLPALGPFARAACPAHALLLACVHPVMHHQNVTRLLWVYDVHLLTSRLSVEEFDAFVRLARERKMAAVCGQALRLAQQTFGTPVLPGLLRRLAAAPQPEPSAAYLSSGRRWHDEFLASVAGRPRWRDRLRHIRQVCFPGRDYMVGKYGLRQKWLGTLMLPALYVHRNVYGVWKLLSGKK